MRFCYTLFLYKLIQKDDGKVEITRKCYPKQVGELKPRGNFVDFIILYDCNEYREPKRNKNDKGNDKRLYIKEEYVPRKIEHKAHGVDKKGIVFLLRLACENDCRANTH